MVATILVRWLGRCMSGQWYLPGDGQGALPGGEGRGIVDDGVLRRCIAVAVVIPCELLLIHSRRILQLIRCRLR